MSDDADDSDSDVPDEVLRQRRVEDAFYAKQQYVKQFMKEYPDVLPSDFWSPYLNLKSWAAHDQDNARGAFSSDSDGGGNKNSQQYLRNVMKRKQTEQEKRREQRLMRESRDVWKAKDLDGSMVEEAKRVDGEVSLPPSRLEKLRQLPAFTSTMDNIDYIIKSKHLKGMVKDLKNPRALPEDVET
jgi:hypothetical protein